MRISTKGRYSLAALLYMATLPKGVFVTTKEIAAAAGTTDGYIEQLFIQLRKMGLIEGVRGRNGGYALAKPSSQISVGYVLRECEGSLKPVVCAGSGSCPKEKDCLSRYTWSALYRVINGCLNNITVNDLAADYNAYENPEYTI
ncbi:MAG: Rrf2 family transcriptional regulator [Spirochaetaceae bacterium]|jgi:Rrf2 family protein|nr:Rrf2 family transcriptional regulator [Spirochaetaceae bacterium]